jgi:hypothetical protein
MEEITLPTPKYSQKIKIMTQLKSSKEKKQTTKKYIDEYYDDIFLNSYFSQMKIKKIFD